MYYDTCDRRTHIIRLIIYYIFIKYCKAYVFTGHHHMMFGRSHSPQLTPAASVPDRFHSSFVFCSFNKSINFQYLPSISISPSIFSRNTVISIIISSIGMPNSVSLLHYNCIHKCSAFLYSTQNLIAHYSHCQ